MTPVSCPVCTSHDTEPFFQLDTFPVQEGRLAETRKAATSAQTADLDFHCCKFCTHAWNRSFDPALIQFDAHYDINLAHSPTYSRYLDDVAKRLVDTYRLDGTTVLEIACGKGNFLRRLVDAGIGDAHGFDPTWVPTENSNGRITFHKGYFDASQAHVAPALVCCRSLLQYIPDPREFLSAIVTSVSPGTILYFEVPDGRETFRSGNVWNLTYEHGSFFNAVSIAVLMESIGCELLNLQSSLGGSVLEVEALVISPSEKVPDRLATNDNFSDAYRSFNRLRRRKISAWSQKFSEWHAEEMSVVLWGAGARAINFLCSVPGSRMIEVVADINPSRQGRFLPVSGQPVVAPNALTALRPDIVIASNPHFADEIFDQLSDLGIESSRYVLD